jgi:hypothetical protein
MAVNYQPPPILDELSSPFTESEAGGIGCLATSLAVGGALTYLLGGVGAVTSLLATPMPPARVLEGGAAAAFIFSSTCYIGVALAPLAMMTYVAIADRFAPASTPEIRSSTTTIPALPATPVRTTAH